MSHLCFAIQTAPNGTDQRETYLVNALRTSQPKQWLSKVPDVTFSFWVIKILSTTVGETTADFLAVNAGLGQGVTRLIMGMLLAVALIVQLRTKRYTRGFIGYPLFW